jgi:hypothetical protein
MAQVVVVCLAQLDIIVLHLQHTNQSLVRLELITLQLHRLSASLAH